MFRRMSVLPIDLGTSSVTTAFATMLGEAAAVCLEENHHVSGVLLSVDCMSKENVRTELGAASYGPIQAVAYRGRHQATTGEEVVEIVQVDALVPIPDESRIGMSDPETGDLVEIDTLA